MNHQKYKELIQLTVYDEISDQEKLDLDNHLLECAECAEELKSVKQVYNAFAANRPHPVSERQLTSARRDLFNSIRAKEEKTSWFEKANLMLDSLLFSKTKLAFGGASTMAIGILVGYILFASPSEPFDLNSNQQIVNLDDINQKKVQISNVRFNNAINQDGELEFVFDATRPVTYKSSVSDKFAQELLSTAMLTDKSAGMRLKSINTIAMQSDDSFIPDNKVKKTLIASLKTDDNPGVRRAAINTLMKFPLDTEIRDAMLFVLTSDDNAGIRIAAINSLSRLKASGTVIDDQIKNTLRNNFEDEENNFIKVRAASLLEEVE